MMQFIGQYVLAIIVTMFAVFAVAEMLVPLRRDRGPLGLRWFTNVTMTLFILLLFKLLGPVFAATSALLASHLELGLFNRIEIGLPLAIPLGILLLDFKQYWFHRLMHYPDWLWRVHRVHHSDLEIDLTTGFRFHPLEAILNALFDLLLIAVFGIAAEVVLLRYLLIFFANFFSHGNIRIPPGLNRMLLWLLVTPSMHHLHHAMDRHAANSNFGVLFSFWDRLFGTYIDQPPPTAAEQGGADYAYGIRQYRDAGRLNPWRLTLMPFESEAALPESPPSKAATGRERDADF